MNSMAMAELMVKLERDCEIAQTNQVSQFHIRSEWTGDNMVTLSEINELNVYFNRKYPMYSLVIIGNNGILDEYNKAGSVVILVGHKVSDPALPDIFHQLYLNAPPDRR